QYGFHAVR
nr:anodontatachykinin [Anodonta cygnea]